MFFGIGKLCQQQLSLVSYTVGSSELLDELSASNIDKLYAFQHGELKVCNC